MDCCYLNRETGTPCGAQAAPYAQIPLCGDHQETIKQFMDLRARTAAVQSAKFHDLDQFPGICYIALLPDGSIKIGYSNTDELLEKRFKDLSRAYEAPVIPLATLKGGFVAEAVLHDRFSDYRLPGRGERFSYSPELARYVAELQS